MRKFYITTTLPYVNADPHIGFALEIIQADVIARHYRQEGYDVFFNTGVDEHGLKIFRKAEERGLETQKYCDIYAEKFKKLKEVLNLSYNSFVRTTDDSHIKAAQEFWKSCNNKGDIYKKHYKVKYCVGCELEKTDSELVNNRCPDHPDKEVETIEEENYFFRYSKYQDQLLELYKKNPQFVLPKARLNEIKIFTERGLKDFSISRLKKKMPWGIPVPGDDDHVMFVWFDALINYVSSLGWPSSKENFNNFWPGVQVAGKDNLRQQSSMWQAMLMSAGLPVSKQIFIHGFITSQGRKMSKSLGNVVDPFDLVKEYGTDSVRYYFLSEVSPTEDGDFSHLKFKERYNADLAGGIGNLTSRIVTLTVNLDKKEHQPDKDIIDRVEKTEKIHKKLLEDFNFNSSLSEIWKLITFADRYIEKNKPWEKRGEDRERAVLNLLFILEKVAFMIEPFMPEASDKIMNQIKNQKSEPLFKRF